jgi:hypothetical protein
MELANFADAGGLYGARCLKPISIGAGNGWPIRPELPLDQISAAIHRVFLLM